MKLLQNSRILSGLCALAGSAALLLRVGLLRYAVDEKQLINHAHVGNVLPLLLSAMVLVLAVLAAVKQPKARRCTAEISPAACGGCCVGALGFAITAVQLLSSKGTPLSTITGVFGIAAACILAFAAYCRFKGQRLHFLLSTVIVLFLMLIPVQLYQVWSAQSQFNRYFFQLLGSVCLLLWAYHRAALDADAGSWRVFTLVRYGAVFFCLAAVPGSAYPFFYLTAGVWALLDSDPVRPCLPKESDTHETA